MATTPALYDRPDGKRTPVYQVRGGRAIEAPLSAVRSESQYLLSRTIYYRYQYLASASYQCLSAPALAQILLARPRPGVSELSPRFDAIHFDVSQVVDRNQEPGQGRPLFPRS